MKLGMKSTFIMAEIKIVCKMENFIHVLKCISVKIAEKRGGPLINLKRVSIWNDILIYRDFSILNSISNVNTDCICS